MQVMCCIGTIASVCHIPMGFCTFNSTCISNDTFAVKVCAITCIYKDVPLCAYEMLDKFLCIVECIGQLERALTCME